MAAVAYSDSRIKQTDKEVHVFLELPGLLRSTIKVAMDDTQTLHVTGQKRVADEVAEVDQKVGLPVPALEKGAKAKYQDGILEVTLPKDTPKPAQTFAIPVS